MIAIALIHSTRSEDDQDLIKGEASDLAAAESGYGGAGGGAGLYKAGGKKGYAAGGAYASAGGKGKFN